MFNSMLLLHFSTQRIFEGHMKLEMAWPSKADYAKYGLVVSYLADDTERQRILNMRTKERENYILKRLKPMVEEWKKKQPRRL